MNSKKLSLALLATLALATKPMQSMEAKAAQTTKIDDEKLENEEIALKLETDRGMLLVTIANTANHYKDNLRTIPWNKFYKAQLFINGSKIGKTSFVMDCTDNIGYISSLHVNPVERLKGYSTLLCALAGKKLLDLGCTAIDGMPNVPNPNALENVIRHYEKMGAQVEDKGTHSTFMKADDEQKIRESIYRITENFINRNTATNPKSETAYNLTFIKNVHVLIANPAKALEHAHKVRADFGKEWNKWLKEHDITKLNDNVIFQTFKEVIAKYEQQCPYFLLGECTADFCLLTRANNPGFRRVFEETVSNALLKKLQSRQQVNYTAFGTGGMLPDLRIIAKALLQKPDAQVTINLIDSEFTPYVAARDLLKDTRQVSTDYTICLDSIINQIIALACTEWGADSKTPINEVRRDISGIIFYKETEIKQFVTTLDKMFPDAKINLLVHSSQSDYLDYIKKNSLSYPDILAAADIQDEISLLKRSGSDHLKLASETCKNNPSSQNFLLKYSPENKLVDIITLVPKTSWLQPSYKDEQGNEFVTESAIRVDLKNEAAKAIARAMQIANHLIGTNK